MSQTLYQQEQSVFDRNLPEWLAPREGQWVVIHGEDVVGFYPSAKEGYLDALDRFGETPFLLREVTARSQRITVPMVYLKSVQ